MHNRGDGNTNLTAAESLRQVTWNGTTKQLWQNVIEKAPIDSECLQSSGLPFPVSATPKHISEKQTKQTNKQTNLRVTGEINQNNCLDLSCLLKLLLSCLSVWSISKIYEMSIIAKEEEEQEEEKEEVEEEEEEKEEEEEEEKEEERRGKRIKEKEEEEEKRKKVEKELPK